MSNEQLDHLTLPKGTVIHYHGIPFRLEADTAVVGRRENLETATATVNSLAGQMDRSLFERVFGKGWWA